MRKLTDSDKKEILKLYRETAETTSTLAERYGVSNSTISRLLKSTLPEDEYEYLVSLKRAARTPEGRAQVSYENIPVFGKEEVEEPKKPEKPKKREKPAPVKKKVVADGERRVKRRSSAASSSPTPEVYSQQLDIFSSHKPEAEIANIPSPLVEEDEDEGHAPKIVAEMLGEDLLDESEELDDLDDLDDDFDDDFDEEEWNDRPLVTRTRSTGDPFIRVLPLSAASLPRTCYIVIDRSAELITRPLEEFGDLGEIPNLENQQRTLPIFDNHRIAKRFSTKRDRVIKVPDSKMLHKARYHLQAKGITRLLIDGQVYSLSVNV